MSHPCAECSVTCRSQSGLRRHWNHAHRPISPGPDEDEREEFTYSRHPELNGVRTDQNGDRLPPHAAPPSQNEPPAHSEEAWFPFDDRASFDFADFQFCKLQASEADINTILDIQKAMSLQTGSKPPQWDKAAEMYETIDSMPRGEVPWKVVRVQYTGEIKEPVPPKWKTQTYEFYVRDVRSLIKLQLQCSAFRGQFNSSPYRQFNRKGSRIFSNLMSADWSWKQCDILAEDPDNHGSMLVPVLGGSDKTTVSVATGSQDFHPVYVSPGNLTNIARRGHVFGLTVGAFLPIPKASSKHRKSKEYQTFVRQLYHSCLKCFFDPLMEFMETPEVVMCPDGYYRRAIYSLGPYIADYPEQVWLSCVVQGWCPKCSADPQSLDTDHARRRTRRTDEFLVTTFDPGILWEDFGIRTDVRPFTEGFPRADIHELLTPDLLHQLIKGTFKDHLVCWVDQYLNIRYGREASSIRHDIDRRISAVPSFPGLRRFPDGRDYKQWTGDDSKALMKVYLAAIVDYVPADMARAVACFMEFCYIARRNAISSEDLEKMDVALRDFHAYREVFVNSGVRESISLPRQHSMKHYIRATIDFGAPNGHCSSITESMHIRAVKEPWRRSNRNSPILQILQTNVRLDKFMEIRVHYKHRGMLWGSTSAYMQAISDGNLPDAPHLGSVQVSEGDDELEELDEDVELGPLQGPSAMASFHLASSRIVSQYPRNLEDLATHTQQPQLPSELRRYLWDVRYPDRERPQCLRVDECPSFAGKISVYHSGVARYFAPSDICGAGGMSIERVRSTPNWRNEYVRRDTVLVTVDEEKPGMEGMEIARVLLFFSFEFDGELHECALVHWFQHVSDQPHHITGMWMVKPQYTGDRPTVQVISVDTILRGAHLLPIFGPNPLPEDFEFPDSLDAFKAYFVNHFADHHAYETLQQ